jgi:hypothetical protein
MKFLGPRPLVACRRRRTSAPELESGAADSNSELKMRMSLPHRFATSCNTKDFSYEQRTA